MTKQRKAAETAPTARAAAKGGLFYGACVCKLHPTPLNEAAVNPSSQIRLLPRQRFKGGAAQLEAADDENEAEAADDDTERVGIESE